VPAPTHPLLLTGSSVAAEGSSSLDRATKLGVGPGWVLRLYPEAGEASGGFRGAQLASRKGQNALSDPERCRQEASRRAKGRVRRYCAANGLSRLGTLTYRGEGCHDSRRVRDDLAAFFRTLRSELGGSPFAYVWTTEWHKSGHGLHVHFAVGQYIDWRLIAETWKHGFVWIEQIGAGKRSSALAEARIAARYLAKYIGKDFEAAGGGLHRYEVAQGFQPRRVELHGRGRDDVVEEASSRMGGPPDYVSTSDEWANWWGPLAVFLSWAA
jgi:hypothetical protein